ncbi:unnamed protein product, partial [Porites lobata]
MKITYLKIFCEECPPGFYTLQRALTTGLSNIKETKCLKCPYGASCANGTIKAKENFWGLEDTSSSPPSLKLFHCPSEYCNRPSNSTHYGHNSCHGRRDGMLCGKCFDGYSEALYSTSCRKNDKCNNNWFWSATGIYVVVFAVYIVFKPPIFSGLLKQSLWFKNKPAETPPSIKLYLAVALETLLLGYERLADTSLKLMHCVPVDKDWRLFVDGTVQCWQWWQFLLTAFIMSFVIPLVPVLFWGSLRLNKDKVTAKEFLIACAFPLPCLLFWMFREYRRKKDDQQMLNIGCVDDAKEIKQVLHGPFRAGSSEDHGTLYWESVLTGRRLILLVIHTFATDPTIRFVCLSCACVIILVHHLTVRPFGERKANICEGFSLLSLAVICMFSLTEATLISHGIDPTGQSKDFFHAVQWIEIGERDLFECLLLLSGSMNSMEGKTVRIASFINYVKLFCKECSSGSYSLQRRFISGLNNTKENKCLKCPYGASCKNGIIKAEENFWGLENNSSSPPSLKFFHCPSEYCGRSSHSTHSDNNSYNSCHGRRDGVLCGKCTDGYSEALYSTLCRKNEKCNNNWFWLATGIYVVVFAVYIVFKPPIFSKLLKHSLWFMNKPFRSDQQRTCEEDKEHDSGYLKIIFYFHQVVELVMIKSPEKTFHLVPIIPPIIAIFNFQVKSLDGSIGCPFPGLTVVTKELFKCMKFLGTLLSIGLIYAIHRATSRSLHTAPPSMKLYLAVALETLLLGYERLADTSLNLMHCVPVEKDWRLFVDAHIQCWQWWQFLLIAFIMSFIIPLVLVLFWGSLKLSKNKVTAKEFLIACAFPLPCLLIWVFREYRKKDDQQMLDAEKVHNAEEIKQVLHGPFRRGSSEDHGTLYWESVLTGRRLILLVIHTFATDPTIRFVCLSCACVIILVHHLTLRPFRKRKANICEGFSLLSLVVICMFSLTEATLISQGIDPSGPSKDLFYALQWIEIGLLSLAPLALCLLVAFCAFSQVARLLYHCITYLSR